MRADLLPVIVGVSRGAGKLAGKGLLQLEVSKQELQTCSVLPFSGAGLPACNWRWGQGRSQEADHAYITLRWLQKH